MNPVDHPHGGGEGKSKSGGRFGRGSLTPWGKPTKSGYKTGPLKRRRQQDTTFTTHGLSLMFPYEMLVSCNNCGNCHSYLGNSLN